MRRRRASTSSASSSSSSPRRQKRKRKHQRSGSRSSSSESDERKQRRKRRRRRENNDKAERRQRRRRRQRLKERRRRKRERRAAADSILVGPCLRFEDSRTLFRQCIEDERTNPTLHFIKPLFTMQMQKDFQRFGPPSPHRVQILGVQDLTSNSRNLSMLRDWQKELEKGPTTIVDNRSFGQRTLKILKHEGDGLFSSVNERGVHLVLFRESADVFRVLQFFFKMHFYNRVLVRYAHRYAEFVAEGELGKAEGV